MILTGPAPSQQETWTSRADMQRWTEAEDAYLRVSHGQRPLREIAAEMKRSVSSIRARVTRLGIAKKTLWTPEEEAALVKLYERAGRDGVLGLAVFARSIGRDPKNVNRKARQLGLEANPSRRVVEVRKERQRKHATREEACAAIAASAKRRIQENGHPRGMKGKHHSDAARQILSEIGKAYWGALTEAERTAKVDKAIAAQKSKGGATPPQIQRGSWKAGWRQIGGKQNFYRSRWEANYARYLEWLKSLKQIAEWKHEPETFWFEAIRRGVRSYKPDFRVWELDGSSSLHEVKGWMDDRSRVCLARMAKYYPHEKIVLIDGRQYRSIRLQVKSLVAGWEDSSRDSHE